MTKILIDEAVAKDTLYALEALARGNPTFESIGYGLVAVDDLRQAIADASLDKMAENARELGLSYEQPAQQEPVDFTSLLREAEEIVQGKPTWKRFIDGTPLSNDIAVWMAAFAQDVARRTTPPAPAQEPVALDPKDVHVEIMIKPIGGFVPVTTSGIRLTHKPTGIVVEETSDRSLHRNKANAWDKLTRLVTTPPAEQPGHIEDVLAMVPPPECQTEAEKTAYAFGWFKALESVREQPAQESVAWRNVIPGGRMTDKWESARVADYNQGWNDYRKAAKTALEKLDTRPQAQEPYAWEFIGALWHDKDEVFAYAKDPELSEESPPLALYTAPLAPAQPLSRDKKIEIAELASMKFEWSSDYLDAIEFVINQCEAAHGIKKGGEA